MLHKQIIVCVVSFVLVSSLAHGTIVHEFTDFDLWKADVDSFSTIDFTDGEHAEYIGDNYADSHGVTFTNAYYWGPSPTGWMGFTSNWLFPQGSGAWVDFNSPQDAIAVVHQGIIAFELSYQGEVIFTSDSHMGGGGHEFFSGVISSQPFDRVYLHRQHPWDDEEVSVEDLHFGTIAPAPGALGVFALAALCARSRRRKRE